jgi:hypothetical protein
MSRHAARPREGAPKRNCPLAPISVMLTPKRVPLTRTDVTFPCQRRSMNADLRRRIDEVLSRLTQLRDSL